MRIIVPAIVSMFAFGCSARNDVYSVSDVCRGADTGTVRIEGYLRLPISTELYSTRSAGENRQRLILVENSNGTGAFVTVFAPETTTAEPNHMDKLPARFTFGDLHIYANSGRKLEPLERIRLTGRVSRELNECSVEIDAIESVNQF